MGRSLDGTDKYPQVSIEDELPEHSATVGPYFLDTFEVTVGRFRKFYDQYDGTSPAAAAGANPHVAGSGWQVDWNTQLPASKAALDDQLKKKVLSLASWTTEPSTAEDRPILASWAVAMAFCIWDNGRLPSEAEWEFAAAGGDENRLFPWGQADYDGTQVFACPLDHTCPAGYQTFDECTFTGPCYENGGRGYAAVGSAPAGQGKFGHQDLAGGVSEWVYSDLPDYTQFKSGCEECTPVLTPSNPVRVNRGGVSQWGQAGSAPVYGWRSVTRYESSVVANAEVGQGFRCARDVPSQP